MTDTIDTIRSQRDALFSLLCRQDASGRYQPVVIVGTEEEALAFNGFASREEAMETLVKWASVEIPASEPHTVATDSFIDHARKLGWEFMGDPKAFEKTMLRAMR